MNELQNVKNLQKRNELYEIKNLIGINELIAE